MTTLAPAAATTVRLPIPETAITGGVLDISIERREGPDAVVSELRLFGSAPVPPMLIVVGDSRGGLIGTVSDAEFAGVAGAAVSVSWSGGRLNAVSDRRGVFRISLRDALPQGQHADITVTAGAGGLATKREISTRTLALGLRELPPAETRLDLAGVWAFAPGRYPDPQD